MILFIYCSDLKIVILGSSGVGKTCLISRYINGTYDGESTEDVSKERCSSSIFVLSCHGHFSSNLVMSNCESRDDMYAVIRRAVMDVLRHNVWERRCKGTDAEVIL